MKNKKFLLLVCAIIVIIIIVFILVKNANYKTNSFKIADGMVKVDLKSGTEYDIDLENASVFTNYDDFSEYFNSSEITSNDFNNNNYAIITLIYDTCKYTNVVPTKYTIFGNTINIKAYHDGCSSCAPLYSYYAVKVSKQKTALKVNIKWIARDKNSCN